MSGSTFPSFTTICQKLVVDDPVRGFRPKAEIGDWDRAWGWKIHEIFDDEDIIIYPRKVLDLSRYYAVAFYIRRRDSPKVLLIDIKKQASYMREATVSMKMGLEMSLNAVPDRPLYYVPVAGHRWTWVETVEGSELPGEFLLGYNALENDPDEELMVLKEKFMAP